jgi:hypothetical protein
MVRASWKTWAACCCLVALWLTLCAASTIWQAWIYETDNPTITVAWDAVEGATYYEVKTIAKYPTQEWVVTVTGTTATLPRKRAGLFRFAVRSCNPTFTPSCSDWAYSDGPTARLTRLDGVDVNQPWGVFWRLSPVIIR